MQISLTVPCFGENGQAVILVLQTAARLVLGFGLGALGVLFLTHMLLILDNAATGMIEEDFAHFAVFCWSSACDAYMYA